MVGAAILGQWRRWDAGDGHRRICMRCDHVDLFTLVPAETARGELPVSRRLATCGAAVLLSVFGGAADAMACAVCTAGDSDSPWVEASNKSILLMIGVVAFVLTGIVSIAGFWFVRAR